MSLLSGFIASHIVTVLEAELASHAPELQAAFVSELKAFADVVGAWLGDKVAAHLPSPAPVATPPAE
jgi:hypothetical protein